MAAADPAGVRILGIDPGSRLTGYGLIEVTGSRQRCLEQGVIRLADQPVPARLQQLFRELRELVGRLQPDEIAMEQVFVRNNVSSALVLGQARGAAICALGDGAGELHEYSPASIKQAVTGSGRAEKAQVQRMVRALLNLPAAPAADAADALACALCHAHSRTFRQQTARVLRGLRR